MPPTMTYMSKPTRKAGHPPKTDGDVLVTVSSNVDPRIVVILDDLRRPAKRTRSQQIALLIERMLEIDGLWPPKSR